MTGVIVISGIDAHPGARHAILTECNSSGDATLFKCPVVLVQIKLIRLRVVRYQDAGPSVIVIVKNRNAQALRGGVFQAGFLCGIFKFAFAQVVPKPRRGPLIRFRRAIRLVPAVERAEEVIRYRPLNVIRYHQIELAIAVVIHPGCAGGEFTRPPQPRRLGYIGKRAVAVVVEKMTLAEGRDEDIVEAVVIVIADCNPQAVEGNGQTGLAGDIAKGSIMVVVIELRRGRPHLRMSGPIRAIDQQNVGVTIVVVIDEGTAGPHSLRQILFPECAIVVYEADAGLSADIAEGDVLCLGGNPSQDHEDSHRAAGHETAEENGPRRKPAVNA